MMHLTATSNPATQGAVVAIGPGSRNRPIRLPRQPAPHPEPMPADSNSCSRVANFLESRYNAFHYSVISAMAIAPLAAGTTGRHLSYDEVSASIRRGDALPTLTEEVTYDASIPLDPIAASNRQKKEQYE